MEKKNIFQITLHLSRIKFDRRKEKTICIRRFYFTSCSFKLFDFSIRPLDFSNRSLQFLFLQSLQTLINMAYCMLILLGKTIQKLVFGELRASESQHLKDKFWNFIFYKFIFVFGVLNVQYMDEVVLWWAWFMALGFLSLLSQLCKDRFEYVSQRVKIQ